METATQTFLPHLLSVSRRNCHLVKQQVPQFVNVDRKAHRIVKLKRGARAETSRRRKQHMLSA